MRTITTERGIRTQSLIAVSRTRSSAIDRSIGDSYALSLGFLSPSSFSTGFLSLSPPPLENCFGVANREFQVCYVDDRSHRIFSPDPLSHPGRPPLWAQNDWAQRSSSISPTFMLYSQILLLPHPTLEQIWPSSRMTEVFRVELFYYYFIIFNFFFFCKLILN